MGGIPFLKNQTLKGSPAESQCYILWEVKEENMAPQQAMLLARLTT